MATHRESKKAFGPGDNEGLAEVALHLPPEEVEVLRGRRREHDVHVHVRVPVVHLVRVVGELKRFSNQLEFCSGQRARMRTCSIRSILDDECSGPAPSRLSDVTDQSW